MRKKAIYVFIVPSIIGFLIFFLIPFIGSLSYALSNGGAFSFLNFGKTLKNEAFRLAFINTIKFLAICVPLNIIIPLLVANAVKALGEKSKLFKLSYISPMVVPVASIALFWSILLSPDGTANGVLSLIGIGDVDILNSNWSLAALAFIFLWKNLGYMMILYLAGLSEIPPSYYESASMDGAGITKRFLHITLPCLRPTIFFVLVLSVVNCFKVFREIYLIAGPYPHESMYMLQHYMNNMYTRGDYSMLTAGAFIIAIVLIAFLFIMFMINRRTERKLKN